MDAALKYIKTKFARALLGLSLIHICKLRVVSENAATEEEWRKYATHAVQSTYGYEYQGDNLLLARVNRLLTYAEHLQARWQRKPTKDYRPDTHSRR